MEGGREDTCDAMSGTLIITHGNMRLSSGGRYGFLLYENRLISRSSIPSRASERRIRRHDHRVLTAKG